MNIRKNIAAYMRDLHAAKNESKKRIWISCSRNGAFIAVIIGAVLSVSLLTASVTAFFLNHYYCLVHIQVLGEISRKIVDDLPQAESTVLASIKEYKTKRKISRDENILLTYGYQPAYFFQPVETYTRLAVAAGCLTGGVLFIVTFLLMHKKNAARIKQLTDYLEKINTGCSGELFWNYDDDFSRLQDEIYKTVTQLYQTRDEALRAKNNFAENLNNIAHQMKTPITAMSLIAQIMKESSSRMHLKQTEQKGQIEKTEQTEQIEQAEQTGQTGQINQIEQQLQRLAHLEEALLLLSRIDAGTLPMERKEVDVFTVLMLAADNLQTLCEEAGVFISIPESAESNKAMDILESGDATGRMERAEAVIYADLDWTMEAVMNLFKNCMEHSPRGGTVYCSYEQNLLYTKILIWDTGYGFQKEDIPHLFERFYRGTNNKNGGIGIGLALSKEIIECQNGTITAYNLADGGACYEIHFYKTAEKM